MAWTVFCKIYTGNISIESRFKIHIAYPLRVLHIIVCKLLPQLSKRRKRYQHEIQTRVSENINCMLVFSVVWAKVTRCKMTSADQTWLPYGARVTRTDATATKQDHKVKSTITKYMFYLILARTLLTSVSSVIVLQAAVLHWELVCSLYITVKNGRFWFWWNLTNSRLVTHNSLKIHPCKIYKFKCYYTFFITQQTFFHQYSSLNR